MHSPRRDIGRFRNVEPGKDQNGPLQCIPGISARKIKDATCRILAYFIDDCGDRDQVACNLKRELTRTTGDVQVNLKDLKTLETIIREENKKKLLGIIRHQTCVRDMDEPNKLAVSIFDEVKGKIDAAIARETPRGDLTGMTAV